MSLCSQPTGVPSSRTVAPQMGIASTLRCCTAYPTGCPGRTGAMSGLQTSRAQMVSPSIFTGQTGKYCFAHSKTCLQTGMTQTLLLNCSVKRLLNACFCRCVNVGPGINIWGRFQLCAGRPPNYAQLYIPAASHATSLDTCGCIAGQFDLSDTSCCGSGGSDSATHNELKRHRASRHMLQDTQLAVGQGVQARQLQAGQGCPAANGPTNGVDWLTVSFRACITYHCSMQLRHAHKQPKQTVVGLQPPLMHASRLYDGPTN